MTAIAALARAATQLGRRRRREVRLDEERPVPMMGAWSLDNGMLPDARPDLARTREGRARRSSLRTGDRAPNLVGSVDDGRMGGA